MWNRGKQACHVKGQVLNLPRVWKDLGDGQKCLFSLYQVPVLSAPALK